VDGLCGKVYFIEKTSQKVDYSPGEGYKGWRKKESLIIQQLLEAKVTDFSDKPLSKNKRGRKSIRISWWIWTKKD